MQRDAYVVGGAGFLGSHLVPQLAGAGWRVAIIDPQACASADVHAVAVAVSDTVLRQLSAEGWQPSCVFHLGGSGSVGQAASDPAADHERTVLSTETLVRHFAGTETRIVFVSSAAVYGDCGETPIGEDQPLRPISRYGVHKAAAEALIAQSGLPYSIVRFFSLYGPGLRKQLLWDACLKLCANTPRFDGNGAELRDWLHVSDAVRLLEQVASPAAASLIVNGGTGRGTRVDHALALLHLALGTSTAPQFSGLVREGDPQHLVADMARVQALGFMPKVRIEEGLERYARWFETRTC